MVISLGIVALLLFVFICGCPCGCTLCSDDFNRADDTDINTGSSCGWTEVAGSWSIASNVLSTSSTSAVAIATVTGTDGLLHASANVTCAAYGDKARMIIDYIDSANYHYAEWTPHATAPTLAVIRKTAGVDATVATNTGTTNVLTALLNVCINEDGNISAYIANVPGSYYIITSGSTSPFAGTQGGCGTGSTVSAAMTFDNFSLRRAKSDAVPCQACTGCICPNCDNSEAPTSWTVVLAGITNGTCMLCSGLNATYYPTCAFAVGQCIWRITFPNVCGYVRILMRSLTSTSLRVDIEDFAITSITQWSYSPGVAPDCDELNSQAFTFLSATLPTCTFTASTCLVSAR